MKTQYQLHIIECIKQLRIQNNFSQAQLATTLGISTGQMGNIETPKAVHKYTLAQILTICQEFKISVADIFLNNQEKQLPTNQQINLLIQKIVSYEQ